LRESDGGRSQALANLKEFYRAAQGSNRRAGARLAGSADIG
jgi:hypothetical protein